MSLANQAVPQFHVYCDESSQTGHRYTVIGASFCSPTAAEALAIKSRQVALMRPSSEYKWVKTKKGNVDVYKALMDAYFQAHRSNQVHFYALVVDNQTVNHRLYNDGDHDLGFSKFMFTLLFKFCRLYRAEKRIYAFLDHRTTRHAPEPMRNMLNAKARRALSIGYDPYRLVRFCKSEDSMMIQLTDIITGAIAYATNQHYASATAAPGKLELMKHITKLAGVHTLAVPTPAKFDGFDIWHLDFSKGKTPRA